MLSFNLYAVVLLFLATHTFTVCKISIIDDYDEIERGNKYIDDLLKEMLHDKGHEYDPYILEDSRAGIHKQILYVNFSAEAKLHNGYIIGLKSLHRPYDCLLQEDGDELLVAADLGAGVLNFHYDGTVKFMGLGPTISVHGELAYVEIRMEFTVNAKTGRDGTLTKFLIEDMKGMKIEITGLGPMNWALNYLISWTTKLFTGYLRGVIERKVRNHIAGRLPNYQFPVDKTELQKLEPKSIKSETVSKSKPNIEINFDFNKDNSWKIKPKM